MHDDDECDVVGRVKSRWQWWQQERLWRRKECVEFVVADDGGAADVTVSVKATETAEVEVPDWADWTIRD